MFAVPLNNSTRDVLSSCGWPPLLRFNTIAPLTLQSLNLSQKACLSFCLFASMVHFRQRKDRKVIHRQSNQAVAVADLHIIPSVMFNQTFISFMSFNA